MPDTIANFPTAISGVMQRGLLAREMLEALRPALNWRRLAQRLRHAGRQGETVTMTRDGLIAPSSAATAKLAPGGAPTPLTRSVEHFKYQVKSYGHKLDSHLPSSFLAQANRFISDARAIGFQGAQSLNRMMRDEVLAAYGGGNTFTTDNPGAVTAVAVKDVTGFDTVVVNGEAVPVSVTNTLPVTIGVDARLVSACVATDGSSPPRGPGVLTITVALDYAQFDAVVRGDAATVVRAADRATDRLIVAGDTAKLTAFRNAAAVLRGHNVPGIDGTIGGDYGAFVDSDTENALFGDSEFRDAIHAQGITGQFADGVIGRYAGIIFMRQPKSEMAILALDAHYQAHIHRSLVFGADVCVEPYTPEPEFANEVTMGQLIVTAQHVKMPIDPEGVLCLVLRAPQDELGRTITMSWVANADWTVPTDSKALTGTQRFKRCVVVHTAGPAA